MRIFKIVIYLYVFVNLSFFTKGCTDICIEIKNIIYDLTSDFKQVSVKCFC